MMNQLIQLLAIGSVLLATYFVLRAFGPPRTGLLFTAEERRAWDSMMGQKVGAFFNATNIFGTLTSLATVYVFFLGSAKLFGGWIAICSVTIWVGAFVTNWFTRRVCEDPYVTSLLTSHDQTGGVIASLFWRPDSPSAIRVSSIVRYISLINIACVVWLEFALFADISGQLLRYTQLGPRVVLLAACAAAVTYFTLRYGLRGFVFADFFHAPIIVLGATALLIGVGILLFRSDTAIQPIAALTPILSVRDCWLFVLQVVSLNVLLVLVTEAHWLRVWIFGSKEVKVQAKSTLFTGVIWGILATVGLLSHTLTADKVGIEAIELLLNQLTSLSPLFLFVFWVAGMGALFSTADAQIYSFIVVHGFNTKTGRLEPRSLQQLRPGRTTLIFTIVFVVAYVMVRSMNLQFEKLIFVLIPLCLTTFPPFVSAVLRRKQSSTPIYVGIALYVLCSIVGFFQTSTIFSLTLLAPVMPVAVGLFIAAQHFLEKKSS